MNKLNINGLEVSIKNKGKATYISLTDLARSKNSDAPADVVKNWMRTRFAIEFMGLWESMHNLDAKLVDFDQFINESGANSFTMSPQKWIQSVNAIGIVSKAGINGGTFAHPDIAMANMESYNASLIKEKLSQTERIIKLNEMAGQQLRVLLDIDNRLLLPQKPVDKA